jgi:hypothetical protein
VGGTSANTATPWRDFVRAPPMLRIGGRQGNTTILAARTFRTGRAASSVSLATTLGDWRCPAFSLSARETTFRGNREAICGRSHMRLLPGV